MPNARERARRRIEAWFARQAEGDREELQREFGRKLSHTQPWVSKMVKKTGPRIEELDDIAAITGITAASLVSDEGVVIHLPSAGELDARRVADAYGKLPTKSRDAVWGVICACQATQVSDEKGAPDVAQRFSTHRAK